MKFLLILTSLLFFNFAHADVKGCAGFYTATLEDMFAGFATPFSDKEILEFGTSTEDDFFAFHLGEDYGAGFDAKLTSSQEEGLMYLEETVLNSMVSFYSSENLVNKYKFPQGVHGANNGAIYLVFMCVR